MSNQNYPFNLSAEHIATICEALTLIPWGKAQPVIVEINKQIEATNENIRAQQQLEIERQKILREEEIQSRIERALNKSSPPLKMVGKSISINN